MVGKSRRLSRSAIRKRKTREPPKRVHGQMRAIVSALEATKAAWEREWRDQEDINPGGSVPGSVTIAVLLTRHRILRSLYNPWSVAARYRKAKTARPKVNLNSMRYYAQHIQNLDGLLSCYIVDEDMENAVCTSIEIGALISEFILRSSIEFPALRAMENDEVFAAQTRGANDAKRAKAARSHAYLQNLADKIWSRHPDWNNTDVATHIVRKEGTGKVGTIRRIIRRRREK